MKKVLGKILKIWLILAILYTVCFFSVGNFIFSFALLRESVFSRENVTAFLTGEKIDTAKYSGATEEETKKTWIEQNAQSRYITSEDGLSLHGYFLSNQNNSHRYAIICHGYSGQAKHMNRYAKNFYNLGYSILCPDARAHGKSEGNVNGMGYLERRDIINWIRELEKNDPYAQIVLFGVSMGGATVLFTSGEKDLPSSVKAVVSDCAFTRVYEQIGTTIRGYVPFMPDFPIVDSASVMCEIRGGYSFRDASCLKAVSKSETPTLFIHGSKDTFVPFYMLDKLYSKAACQKQKLVVEGAAHARSAVKNPELYWSTVKAFTDLYVK